MGEEALVSLVLKTRTPYTRGGFKLIFTGSHISLTVAFKGLNVTLGLYKCNYSLTVKWEVGATAR